MATTPAPTPQSPAPPSAFRRWKRRLIWAAMTGCALLLIHIGAIAAYGLYDDIGKADLIIVFGNRVHPNGKPSSYLRQRLDRARELFADGMAPRIFVSGGLGKEGVEEADVMRDWLVGKGVPTEAIITDRDGYTTRRTAENAARYMHEHGLTRVIVSTHYTHIPRACLAMKQEGIAMVYRAHAKDPPTALEPYILFRECAAWWYYSLLHTGE